MDGTLLLYLMIALVALLYSSVGHGGASGYLAAMTLFGIAPVHMRSSAFVLNIIVSLIAFVQYYRSGHFVLRKFLPFALASVPCAYVGAMIPLGDGLYRKILGVILLFAALRLVITNINRHIALSQSTLSSVVIGMAIGVVSGMTGVGGGILLSPILLLFGWADMKQTAAISAAFIFVNSIAGLSALVVQGTSFHAELAQWVLLAVAGGVVGAYLGARWLDTKWMRVILAIVLLIASVKLLVV